MSFFEISNFLPVEKCIELINICNGKDGKPILGSHVPNQHRIKFFDEEIGVMIQRFFDEQFSSNLSSFQFSVCQNFSYVRYENGGHITRHTDSYSEKNVKYTIIMYLNDDYVDGETFIIQNETKTNIEKKIGKAFIFEGSNIVHGSNTVIGTKNILIGKIVEIL